MDGGNYLVNKILVLAEKPSVGRDIAKVLNCNKKGNGYLEGQRHIVTWALGHLVTLANPELYDKKYKFWEINDLPIIPFHLKLVVIKKTGKQFNVVKKQMNRKDVNKIVIATDAGREGELVARWIIEKAHVRKPIKRLWISSVTDKAIKNGFNKLKDGKEYENLYLSAVARAEADWILGINATRALTCKYNAQLSCGRVQTPTLAMIDEKEQEIKKFKSRTFYGITVKAKGLELIWRNNKNNSSRTFNKDKCNKILKRIKDKNAKVIKVDKIYKKSFSPKLYDLTELQRDANKIFNYSAKETLNIMQRLYERHKILTYPRTDSRYISTDIVDTLKDRVKACNIHPYLKTTNKILKNPIKTNKTFVDNKKISDHHAIIPTEQKVLLSLLTSKERKIYDLVVKRFLSVLYPPFEYEKITIKFKIGDEFFVANAKNVINKGWKEVYKNDVNEDEYIKNDGLVKIVSNINKDDTLNVSSAFLTEGETKPPAPFNEASLLSAMENPVKYMPNENKNLIKTIGESGGIGTVATRADIIEKLFNTCLIEKKGKDIFITSKGKQLLDLVPEDLKSPILTAQWEQKLNKISKGFYNKDIFIKDIKNYTKVIIKNIKDSKQKFKHDNITRNKCPQCGMYMLEIKNKKGKILVCQNRDCGYRKPVFKITNARCPKCHKKLQLRGEGESQIFTCSCGYREKLSTFNKRKKKQKNSMSKRELNRYLKKQKKESQKSINTSLAEALSKLNLN